MGDKHLPTPEEIQREFEAFVKRRFGDDVRVVTTRTRRPRPERRPEFHLRPKDVKTHLDRYVVRQDDAKKALSIAVCDHYNRLTHEQQSGADGGEYAKQNVLLLGPTGVGKTYLVRQVAKLIGVPFVKADATRFSETGYVGANVEDLVHDLVAQADGDLDLARYGIIYLDEVDKLATTATAGMRDVSGRGVQFGLLKLMEETDVDLAGSGDPRSQMQAFLEMQQRGRVERKVLSTRHILFIASGAFHGLEEIVRRRLGSARIGFGSDGAEGKDLSGDDWAQHVATDDFVKYGFEPEFIGRMPVRVACRSLDAEALYEVLRDSEGSLVRQYEQTFAAYGLHAIFTDQALRSIAARAAREKTGARALMTVCEQVFRDYKFELPSSHVTEFVVTSELVDDPRAVLGRLLADPVTGQRELAVAAVRRYEAAFLKEHGIRLKLDDDAVGMVCDLARARRQAIGELLEERLGCYEHGLKLVQQNSGQRTFVLGRPAILEPLAELERLIVESYGQRPLPH